MTNNDIHGSKLQNDRADAAAAARSGAQIAGAVREGATAMQQSGHVTNEAVRRGVEATAEMTRQGTQAGMEATRRAGEAANETVRRSTQAVAEGQRQIAQEAGQTFQEVSRKMAQVAQGTSEEVRRFATLPHAAQGGLRDLQQGVAGLIEGVVQTNLHATQELFRLANPAVIIELQQRFAREYMDTVMQNTVTLVRAVRRTADETLHPLEAQVAQRQQARPSYHTAAE
jgi:hypothetical protein